MKDDNRKYSDLENIDNEFTLSPIIHTNYDVNSVCSKSNGYIIFILYSIFSLIFLWSYEIAGIITIHQETGDYIIWLSL